MPDDQTGMAASGLSLVVAEEETRSPLLKCAPMHQTPFPLRADVRAQAACDSMKGCFFDEGTTSGHRPTPLSRH